MNIPRRGYINRRLARKWHNEGWPYKFMLVYVRGVPWWIMDYNPCCDTLELALFL